MAERKYLEDLDVFNTLLSTALLIDGTPLFNDTLDINLLEPCKSEIMARVEAKDVTAALHRLGGEQRMRRRRRGGAGRR